MDKAGMENFIPGAIYILAGAVIILAAIILFTTAADKSHAKDLELCKLSLDLGDDVEDVKGPFKFLFKKSDLCGTYAATVGEYGGGPDAVETEIMQLIAKAWTTTLQGQPKVFGSKPLPNKQCYIVWVFEIEEKRNQFDKGMFIKADDFWAHLGEYPYQTFEGEEYSYMDYVQDSPSGFPGRIDVFPSRSDPDYCKDGSRTLSKEECQQRKDAEGFYPNRVYAIAVVSGQASLKFLQKSDTANNYIIVDKSSVIETLCESAT